MTGRRVYARVAWLLARLVLGGAPALLVALEPAVATAAKPAKPAKPKAPKAPATPKGVVAPAAGATTPAPVATPTAIPVTVAEVAAHQAFLRPGAKGGVHRGALVTLNKKTYTVVQTTDSFAVIDLGDAVLREQDKGVSTVVAEETTKAVELAKPTPVAEFAGGWTPVEAPAASQTPRFVPIGNVVTEHRYDVRITAAAGALLPFDQKANGIVSTELNARVHAEPFRAAPAAFDLDVSLLNWLAPHVSSLAGADARPLVRVRELMASYRSATGYFGAIGRLPYAASTLGTLDGLRVSAPLGKGFSVGAFGGLLPEPLSGAPSLDAERFGLEARYSDPLSPLRPEAALVVNGSVFGGKLDERKLSAVVGVYPGPARLGAHVDVQSFAPDNPWKAKAIEVTAAGLDASVRRGVFELSGRFDLRQPERSLWLASYLPVSWFCRAVPKSPGATTGPDVCDGSVSSRAFGEVDASVHFAHFAFLAGGTTTGDLTQTGGAASTVGGFAVARVMRIARRLRFDLSGNYSKSTYIDMYGGTAGPGVTLFQDALDVSAYYRASLLQYRADTTTLIQHGIGATAMVFPNAPVMVAVQAEGITGNDTQALVLFGTVTWRPRF